MENKKNSEIMHTEFDTISAEAGLKEAFEAIRKNLESPLQPSGLVVLDERGECAGVLTINDLMKELSMLYHDACDRPGQKDWADKFFNQCEIAGARKVLGIVSSRGESVHAEESFETACELILGKNMKVIPVIEGNSKIVGIITNRMVLEQLGPKMFK
jgi:CBS domain-containing protein